MIAAGVPPEGVVINTVAAWTSPLKVASPDTLVVPDTLKLFKTYAASSANLTLSVPEVVTLICVLVPELKNKPTPVSLKYVIDGPACVPEENDNFKDIIDKI